MCVVQWRIQDLGGGDISESVGEMSSPVAARRWDGKGGGIHACCTAGSATVCVCVCDSVFLCVFVLYVMMCKAIVKGRGGA